MAVGGLGPRSGPETLSMRVRRRLGRELWLRGKAVTQRLQARAGVPQQVIFVAGTQRSGTNMLVEILERSWHTDVYRETDPRAFVDYQHRPLPELTRVVRGSPARYVVLKALCELQDLKSLLAFFAPARAAWMLRHYDDVANSATELWHKMPHFLGEILNRPDGGEAGWRASGVTGAMRAELARHWRPDIDNASACALFWWLRNSLFFTQGLEHDARVRVVSYEALVSDPHHRVPLLFEFMQVPFDSRVMAKVTARSVRKHAPPAIAPAVRDLCDALLARFQVVG